MEWLQDIIEAAEAVQRHIPNTRPELEKTSSYKQEFYIGSKLLAKLVTKYLKKYKPPTRKYLGERSSE